MVDPVRRFYDPFSRDYHLIYENWDDAIREQSRALDRIIRRELGPPPLDLLDCACGIGTQAIGLALLRYKVHGTDLSLAALRRARREARTRGARLSIAVADFSDLAATVRDTYDVVICCDNALAHAMNQRDLDRTMRSIASRLRQGGLFIASIRDYDRITKIRPTFTDPSIFPDSAGTRIVFQYWRWHRDRRTYNQDLFIIRGTADRWTLHHHRGLSHAWLRTEASAALRRAGMKKVRWLFPALTGYKQPIVIARRTTGLD